VVAADSAAAAAAATEQTAMQSSDKLSVSAVLAAATCTLLGTTAAEPVQAQEEPGWDFNTSLLYYGEGDDRVQDLSLKTLSRRTFEDDRYLSLGFTVDALTGATPNGALPQSFPQTFTKPSGRNTFTTPPGEFPIDDSFRDTRVAITADWAQPLGRFYTISAGISGSFEYDYVHLGINGKLSRDFNNRNTTLSGGFAFSSDEWDPVGGVPVPLTPMQNVRDEDDGLPSGRLSSEDKEVLDLVFGVTQVISRNFLMQFNYSYSDSSGYLTDPYKILTAVDSITGDAVPVPQLPGVEGPSHLNYYEHRPDSRTKHSLYAQGKYYMSGKVLDASYRYMTDDWEIDSHTLDLRYRWPVGDTRYLEPHLRFYTQSAAEFYRISLTDGDPLPEYASADYRLGDFDAITAGLKFGWKTGGGNDMSVRLELYSQSGNVSPSELVGNQADRDAYPDMDAIIFQYSYQFGK
jgi:hypothetical protein